MMHFFVLLSCLFFSTLRAATFNITEVARFTMTNPNYVFNAPALITANGQALVAGSDSVLYFLDQNANLQKIFKANDSFRSAPTALPNGGWAVSSQDKRVYLLNSEGHLTTAVHFSSPNLSRPVVFGDVSFLIASENTVYFQNFSGDFLNLFTTGGRANLPLAINHELFVVGDSLGNINFVDRNAKVLIRAS